MKNLIHLPEGISTVGILRHELKRIETETGYTPEDWLSDVYNEAYEEYMSGDDFDWEGFALHLSCVADSFIDFIHEHYQNLNNQL